MIRVLIADDPPIVREGLKQILFETDDIRSEQTCGLARHLRCLSLTLCCQSSGKRTCKTGAYNKFR